MEKPAGESELLREASRVLERAKELQDSASSLISKTKSEEQSLCHRALALDSEIGRLKRSIGAAAKAGAIDYRTADQMEEKLFKAKCVMSDGDVSSFLPVNSNDRFLRMFLGPINVRAIRKDVQLKMKEEYNSFRDRTAVLFMLFPFILLFLRNWFWDGCFPALPVQLYQACIFSLFDLSSICTLCNSLLSQSMILLFQAWLLFLYTSLALRENILRANGSDIRPWWVYHHYCAMGMALISLTWEIEGGLDCARKQRGVQLFLAWAMMQGVAMLLQNRYQRQRLYTRIALGKARRMDVVWGETAGVEGQLWLLYPILFVLQAFEAYVGILLLQTAVSGVVSEWQVVVCGIILVVMAIGNFMNTVQTLMAKSRFKAMKRSRSKQDFDHGQPTSPSALRHSS
ncbi:unnamed protein product [Victoria cruziana]